jgi:type II secretory pathway component PulJ
MGFSSLIDVLGATIVGGLLLLILWRLDDSAVENTYVYNSELMVQENLVSVVQLLEYDFRKIGYCADWEKIPDPSKAIIMADSNSIKFETDINNDGNVDTLYYYLGPKSELSNTPNPNDRLLYRVVNNETPRSANLGIVQFNLIYFDALGNKLNFPITQPGEIYTIEINITVENPAAYDNNYSTAFWRQIRLAARNLQNR